MNTNFQFSIFNFQVPSKGFSLVEMVVTIGLISTFLGFITISLLDVQRSTSMNASLEIMISDFRSQQLKAMVGDTEGRSSADSYGIYFDDSSYTLFHGTSYNSSDTSNFTISLDPQYHFSPVGRTVIFSRFSGEVSGYSASQNTISVEDTTNGIIKTMTFNAYGIPVSLN